MSINDKTNSDTNNVTLVADDEKRNEAHKSKYEAPKRKPTKAEERKLVGKSIELMIVTCMKNHVYRFDNKIRLQLKGGPIGLALTGEVAECYMINWDKKFLQKVKDIGINLNVYSRFKDDILVAANNVKKGSKLVGGKLEVDMDKKILDEDKCDESVSMEIVRQIAQEVDPMIKLTVEVPSDHKDGKLRVLDIKLNVNREMGNRIDYEFYEKSTKHPKVLLADSAINSSSKRTILTQECLRRLRNTKIELGEDVRNMYLNQFMIELKNSGYKKNYRIQILQSATKAFDKMVHDDKLGIKPLYRNRTWNLEERTNSKKNKKTNWYKSGEKSKIQYKSILFVPPTPGSMLLKELRQREEELNGKSRERIKIVEKGGKKIGDILINKNPFKPEKCTESWCPLCSGKYGKSKIQCNTNNLGYRWVCKTCQNNDKIRVYEGETSRLIRIRTQEHIKAFEGKKSHSVLLKHKLLDHGNEENVEYGLEITGIFKDALSRQANESVRIYKRQSSETMNSKSEFNHPPTARVVVEKKINSDYKAKQTRPGSNK